MNKATLHITSLSPYSQSRFHGIPRGPKELAETHEERTWKEKGHYNNDGYMFIPPMALANSIKEAAKYLSMQIPGKGKSTYTKHFQAGIMIVQELALPVTRETVYQNWIFANSDGKKGSGSRVRRAFPTCLQWEGKVEVNILDEILTKDVLQKTLYTAGNLIGIGQFRPINGGYFGRYKAEIVDWEENI